MTKMKNLIILLVCAFLGYSRAVIYQNLGGISWTASNENKSITIQSRVPGSIYSDLEGNGKIGPIYKNFNDVLSRWVAYDNWTFERHFDVNANVLTKQHIFLTAHGLDTIATVTLNDQKIISAANMFVRYTTPVKSILKAKHNTLKVHFVSAPLYAKRRFEEVQKEKYLIPPTCVPGVEKGECHVNMLRKMQASFAWDWGPAIPTAGIWQPLLIEAYDSLLLRDVTVETVPEALAGADNNSWELKYTLFAEIIPGTVSKGTLEVLLDGHLLSNSSYQFESLKGEAKKAFSAKIPSSFNIQRWWPNGLGQQKLYNLTIRITPEHQEAQSKTLNIGFRTVELVQERLHSKTEAYSFYFKVNGVPFFAKGSNWIPAHALNEAITEGYLRTLLHSAKLANINMLRIWGGGKYEDDTLYQIADEYGIFLWHDMMFACALYETDKAFLESVAVEVTQQIRRLQHHPSIAIWAGNNENEVAIATGWWKKEMKEADLPRYKDDYRALYIATIMPIVAREDTSRPFVASSPSNGILSPRENYIGADPNSALYGDVHFYTTRRFWEWSNYPSAKFVSEYGFQSWASLHTMAHSLEPTDLRYPLDRAWLHREHSEPWFNLAEWIGQYLPVPSAGGAAKLADYIYVSQIFQAMSIRTETEFYRRNRAVKENGEGGTMGCLYWQLQDIWPTVSWASLEFGGRWKMLHYYVRQMFASTLLTAWEEDGHFRVAVVRDDHRKEEMFQLQIDLFEWSSLKAIHSKKMNVKTKPFNVTLVFEEKADAFLKSAGCTDRKKCLVTVRLVDQSGHLIASNFHLLDWPKNAVGLKKAKISVSSVKGPVTDEEGNYVFLITLTTDAIAPFVWIDFVDTFHYDGVFSNNGFFFIEPTVNVNFTTRYNTVTVESVRKSLLVKSIADVN